MFLRNPLGRSWLLALLAFGLSTVTAQAQIASHPAQDGYRASVRPSQQSQQSFSSQPTPYRVAERLAPVANRPRAVLEPAQPGEHPLMPSVRWAKQGAEEIRLIQDYSATLVKRERINGKVGEYQYMFIKMRHKPMSVYMYFIDPGSMKGQEVIFVEGLNDGNMWAHPPGLRNKIIGTVSLDPTGPIAMRGNRYPITEIGVLNLVERLAEIGAHDTQYGECEVKYFQGAKINGRSCTCLQVVHPVPRRNFRFHLARIFVDDELNLPLRYESHDWPKEPGGPPQLLEEYTYLNIKVNNGFTDADFDVHNPNYQFNAK